jgi:hypothetical protein
VTQLQSLEESSHSPLTPRSGRVETARIASDHKSLHPRGSCARFEDIIVNPVPTSTSLRERPRDAERRAIAPRVSGEPSAVGRADVIRAPGTAAKDANFAITAYPG